MRKLCHISCALDLLREMTLLDDAKTTKQILHKSKSQARILFVVGVFTAFYQKHFSCNQRAQFFFRPYSSTIIYSSVSI